MSKLNGDKPVLENIDYYIFAYNPKASNILRAKKWHRSFLKNLHFNQKTEVNIIENPKLITEKIRCYSKNSKILIAIGGGDGTVSSITNQLLNDSKVCKYSNIYLLPLWGGNANDLAYMLNGLSKTTSCKKLINDSINIKMPLIKIDIESKNTLAQTFYANCYASFGASAYIADKLESSRSSSKRFIKYFPPFLIIREVFLVIASILEATVFRMEIDSRDTNFFEHSFVNGPRMAKVSRLPISLHEKAFFHAQIKQKSPSVIIELIKLAISGKSSPNYKKKEKVTFIAKEPITAQIDGEIHKIPAHTKIAVTSLETNLKYISLAK